MSADLDWTTDLGDAEVNQPQDVAEVIQEPSRQGGSGWDAQDDGSADDRTRGGERAARSGRASGDDSAATRGELYLHPADRSVDRLCPDYDPAAVYQPYSGVAPLLGFGAGIAVGALWNNNYWNWGTGAIYPPTWAGYSGWSGNINNGNVNIGNNVKPWRPNGDYRPGMGSKPDIGGQPPRRRRPTWEARRHRWTRPSRRRRGDRGKSVARVVRAGSAVPEALAAPAVPAGQAA